MSNGANIARVVIAEDEAIVAFDLSLRLRSMGYDVLAMVSSGEDAIDAARRYMPDIMLMDIGLKGMDGLTAGRIINRESNITLFLMSAYSKEIMETDIAGLPSRGYLCKPFSDYELKSVLGVA